MKTISINGIAFDVSAPYTAGHQITEAEAKEALERALKLQASATNQVELEKAHQLVDRHMVRLKVADLHRRHRGNLR